MTSDPATPGPAAPADRDGEPAAGSQTGSAVQVAALEAELADCRDRLLRVLADQENARRRAGRERDEAVKYAASGLARDLLATADNLRRAIASVPEEKAADPAMQRWIAGVEATERALLEALAKHGIRRIEALGGTFDPDRHEAAFEVTGSEHPEGTVADVLQEGYLHHDRLLRPAMVGVAKSGEARADQGSDDRRQEPPPVDRTG
jgi:molecular chaperone GrpE